MKQLPRRWCSNTVCFNSSLFQHGVPRWRSSKMAACQDGAVPRWCCSKMAVFQDGGVPRWFVHIGWCSEVVCPIRPCFNTMHSNTVHTDMAGVLPGLRCGSFLPSSLGLSHYDEGWMDLHGIVESHVGKGEGAEHRI